MNNRKVSCFSFLSLITVLDYHVVEQRYELWERQSVTFSAQTLTQLLLQMLENASLFSASV